MATHAPPWPGTSLALSVDAAFRFLSRTVQNLSILMTQEEFELRPRHKPCSALLHLGIGNFNSIDSISDAHSRGCEFKLDADRVKTVSIAFSRDDGSETMYSLENDGRKCLFVAMREHSETADPVGDSASSCSRSAEIKALPKENNRVPCDTSEDFTSKEGEPQCHQRKKYQRVAKEPGEWWIGKAARAGVQAKELMKDISVLERAQIGAGAGGIAGMITYACLHPLDTVKTKLQTRGASALYSGPLDVIVKTFKNQGLLGFYSGISAVLVGSMFSSAVYFGTCELGKALFSQVPNCPPIVIPPLAGAMGNLVSSAVLVPKELITQRMQAGATGRSWEVLMRTVEKEGLGGLYTGYSAALVRNLPASVLSFSSFEYLKAAWLRKSGKNRLEPWQSVTSGALAGALSAALTTPLDVVKTRLMTQARNLSGTVGGSKMGAIEAELYAKMTASTYQGISSTLRKIWLEEGWIGLTKGVIPRILYSACFSALGYFAFETARLELAKRHIEKKKLLSLPT